MKERDIDFTLNDFKDYVKELNDIKTIYDDLMKDKEIQKLLRLKKQYNVINKLEFIRNRKNQGASQENINKMAIELVNNYLKEVSE